MHACTTPLPDVLSPLVEGLPDAELGKGLDPDEPVEVVVVLDPLGQLDELRLLPIEQPGHSVKTEGAVVSWVYLQYTASVSVACQTYVLHKHVQNTSFLQWGS